MAYSTLATLKARYKIEDLTLYSDLDGSGQGEPVEAVDTLAIVDGDSWINRALASLYTVPIAVPYPAEIVELSCRCAMHLLRKRAGADQKDEEEAINKILTAYADGTTPLTGASTAASAVVSYGGVPRVTEKTEEEFVDPDSIHPMDYWMEV